MRYAEWDKSHLVQEWFQANTVEARQWPAQSPDVNPVQNLWRKVERQNQTESLITEINEISSSLLIIKN